MVCWARMYLKAHSLLQVLAGALLGASSVVLFFWGFHIVKF